MHIIILFKQNTMRKGTSKENAAGDVQKYIYFNF